VERVLHPGDFGERESGAREQRAQEEARDERAGRRRAPRDGWSERGRSGGRILPAAAQLVYRSSLNLRRQPPATGSKMWQ